MASSKAYLDFLLEQLPEGVTRRAMMGEYLLYYREKLIGGVYDDRFLVKPVPAAIRHLKEVTYEVPYEGAKEMLLVDDVDDRAYLAGLLEVMVSELPESKSRKKK